MTEFTKKKCEFSREKCFIAFPASWSICWSSLIREKKLKLAGSEYFKKFDVAAWGISNKMDILSQIITQNTQFLNGIGLKLVPTVKEAA